MDNSVVMNNGRKEYTITWFIENYSYCWHKKGEYLTSPKFTFDSLESTVWTLQLCPRGSFIANKGNISLYLNRSVVDKSPGYIRQMYELAVLAADGQSALHSIQCEYKWNPLFGYGVPEFLRIDEVLLRQKANYLHQGTLIVRCRMWKDEEKIMKVAAHCSARTRIGIEKISFLHKVENFSGLKPNEKKTLQVQSHSKTGCIISSSLYFIDAWSLEGTIIVEIVPSDKNYILRKLKLSFLDRSGNVVDFSEVDNRFDDTILDIQKVPLSLTRQVILNRKGEYLSNDELSLICECTFSTGVDLQKIEEIQHELPIAALKQSCSIPANKDGYNAAEKLSACRSALDDLKTIYSNQRLTDIELKTKTKSFLTHKLVLCARSSVFNAMLTNDMKEKNTDCIQVDDLENDTVQQLLLFLYSDNLENLQWESAIKLYYAGDKYAIEKLKVLCSSFLIDNLSTSTASELLLLADTHNDTDLKKFVEDFILEHEDDVFGSEGWEKLIDTNPQLVIKTMHLKYKRKRGGK
ncbi:Speckle-type POZ protein [Araneus ventricosus]|uniref:Speckle-type POZ protein n=1 Tax=Araneus ventricosus TaxID=182803 RepID=A0A4Y2GTC4_ARAVE|nr:Speckle-type POZ protein [Araneus ventricosus]